MNKKRLLTMVLISTVLTPSYAAVSEDANNVQRSAESRAVVLPAAVRQAINTLKNAGTNAEKETALVGLINAITVAAAATPESAADIVEAAVTALPDYAAAIVTAAIAGAPDYVAEIVTAAVTAAPNSAAAIVTAALAATPDSADQAIITAAINAGGDSGVVSLAATAAGVDSEVVIAAVAAVTTPETVAGGTPDITPVPPAPTENSGQLVTIQVAVATEKGEPVSPAF